MLEELYREAARMPPPMTAVPTRGADDFKTRCESIMMDKLVGILL